VAYGGYEREDFSHSVIMANDEDEP
jgi:hypothetical protein